MSGNDFDSMAKDIDEVMQVLAGNAHEFDNEGDSITITKMGFIQSVIRLQRLRNRCSGLAEGYRMYEGPRDPILDAIKTADQPAGDNPNEPATP